MPFFQLLVNALIHLEISHTTTRAKKLIIIILAVYFEKGLFVQKPKCPQKILPSLASAFQFKLFQLSVRIKS
jgi:hypothetical protein